MQECWDQYTSNAPNYTYLTSTSRQPRTNQPSFTTTWKMLQQCGASLSIQHIVLVYVMTHKTWTATGSVTIRCRSGQLLCLPMHRWGLLHVYVCQQWGVGLGLGFGLENSQKKIEGSTKPLMAILDITHNRKDINGNEPWSEVAPFFFLCSVWVQYKKSAK